ncbi:hypothetical protein [Pseudomonas putida]|uniref:hypothetical protein n=1 Tax=Pseudomonas putida TaxID=303 RepID=UPI0035579A87
MQRLLQAPHLDKPLCQDLVKVDDRRLQVTGLDEQAIEQVQRLPQVLVVDDPGGVRKGHQLHPA